jgi:4'-phosphopantetheinyl transferase
VAVGALLGVREDGLRWARNGGRTSVTTPDGASLSVSLSTSRSRALAAAAAHPVGVDLVVRQPVPEARVVSDCLLAADERRWVVGAGGDDAAADRFLRTWVRKEAVVKATGEGLAGRPSQGFVVDARTDDPRRVRNARGRRLGLWTCGVPVPGAHAALAWPEAPAAEAPDGPGGCTRS